LARLAANFSAVLVFASVATAVRLIEKWLGKGGVCYSVPFLPFFLSFLSLPSLLLCINIIAG
jgi:hypothetical protein